MQNRQTLFAPDLDVGTLRNKESNGDKVAEVARQVESCVPILVVCFFVDELDDFILI